MANRAILRIKYKQFKAIFQRAFLLAAASTFLGAGVAGPGAGFVGLGGLVAQAEAGELKAKKNLKTKRAKAKKKKTARKATAGKATKAESMAEWKRIRDAEYQRKVQAEYQTFFSDDQGPELKLDAEGADDAADFEGLDDSGL